ncbi:TIGR03936 family radical SAM-associated protein [Fuchsiella alkaliacetigena]|uniref:TIGR03936 family radical SAM-associated protein n=1 Tax=Fuchsiella alkaliacetigena TaxID=957042 RepID=UPI00200B7DD0|nr:TIGR03936 family radical SAM-associated protein [Fuchsiella alkaliacetigena]MCK8825609.1 TIGR03936 family radical SAM-associated protein [Fuchsiella alkaliacetigena]
MKIRVKLTKGEQVKFISHLDLLKVLSRAVRRAEIPIEFSQGYNPRPAIAAGPALAVGITSCSEYFDFELATEYPLAEFKADLGAELPAGIDLIAAQEIEISVKSLMAQINAARYELDLQLEIELKAAEVEEILADFLANSEVIITRKRRNKSDRQLDLRPLVFELQLLETAANSKQVLLEALIQTGSSGNLRPQELVRALQKSYPISEDFSLTDIKRTGLYIKEADKLLTPFEVISK